MMAGQGVLAVSMGKREWRLLTTQMQGSLSEMGLAQQQKQRTATGREKQVLQATHSQSQPLTLMQQRLSVSGKYHGVSASCSVGDCQLG